jgi:hypothetical protein
MDDLRLQGTLGAAVSGTALYARDPLRIDSADNARPLNVVDHQAFTDVAMALLFDRYRLSLHIASPLYTSGHSGMVNGYQYTAPAVDVGKFPDKVMDVRIGLDARLFGATTGPFRLGLGAQLIVPSGERKYYFSDGTYRAIGRLLFAGDSGVFTYAGHLGFHLRPRDDSPAPGGPRGNELLFGAAVAPRLAVGADGRALVVGPEIFGVTAFNAFFGKTTTALEALLAARFEFADARGGLWRLKLGIGDGLNPEFGAAEWRGVAGVELSGRVE